MSNLSARNQLRGTVSTIVTGGVMAEVTVDVDGNELVAVITRHSVERLDLQDGDEVTVLVKATEVMLAKGSTRHDELSTRNQIPGKVKAITLGSVMAEATVAVDDNDIVAAVTRQSVERLGLREGDDVLVLVKATEVMLAK